MIALKPGIQAANFSLPMTPYNALKDKFSEALAKNENVENIVAIHSCETAIVTELSALALEAKESHENMLCDHTRRAGRREHLGSPCRNPKGVIPHAERKSHPLDRSQNSTRAPCGAGRGGSSLSAAREGRGGSGSLL